MHAMCLVEFNDTFQLVWQDHPEPSLQPGEVLLRMLSAGVNPIDYKTCAGGGAAAFIGPLPFIPGWELAGEVIACGANVSHFHCGDRVCGLVNFPQPGRCFAEQTSVPATQLCRLPPSADIVAAGALPLAGLTAWQALFDVAALQPGQRVLVLAGAGGVGHLAIQLAHQQGANVSASASPHNHAFLHALGCEQVFDYHQPDWYASAQGFDVILDGVGGEEAIRALACLNKEGCLVSLPSATHTQVVRAATDFGYDARTVRVEPNQAQLQQLVDRLANGQLQVHIQQRFPLRQASTALQQVAQGHVCGKLVIEGPVITYQP